MHARVQAGIGCSPQDGVQFGINELLLGRVIELDAPGAIVGLMPSDTESAYSLANKTLLPVAWQRLHPQLLCCRMWWVCKQDVA